MSRDRANRPDDRRANTPVIVVGTPRSGTSLVHRILRSQPGIVAPTREAQPAWARFTHPARRDWEFEGWGKGGLTPSAIRRLRRCILRASLPAAAWRRIDERELSEKRHAIRISPAVTDPVFDWLVRLGNLARGGPRGRLVFKSVHAPLWLDLVDVVFPDAVYVHVTREPAANLRSMVRAWLDPERFFTYRLPATLRISGYPHERWNFGLPAGWRERIDRPLEDVVAFQWASMQREMLTARKKKPRRWHTLRLEALVDDPGSALKAMGEFLGLGWNPYLERFARSLPRVNVGAPAGAGGPTPSAIDAALAPYAPMAESLGYRR